MRGRGIYSQFLDQDYKLLFLGVQDLSRVGKARGVFDKLFRDLAACIFRAGICLWMIYDGTNKLSIILLTMASVSRLSGGTMMKSSSLVG